MVRPGRGKNDRVDLVECLGGDPGRRNPHRGELPLLPPQTHPPLPPRWGYITLGDITALDVFTWRKDLRKRYAASTFEELLFTYADLNNGSAMLPATERPLFDTTEEEWSFLEHLDARTAFVHIGREWVRAAEPEEVQVGLALLRVLVWAMQDASAQEPGIFSDIVVELLARGRLERNTAILTGGLRLARDAAFIALPTSALAAVTQGQRGECAHELYLLTGDTEALTEAVTALRAAVEASSYRVSGVLSDVRPPDYLYLLETEDPRHSTGRVQAGRLAVLARCLLDRHSLTGDEDDLHAAVDVLREALDIAPPDDPDRPGYQVWLARALTAQPTEHVTARLGEAVELATAGRTADGGAELGRLLEMRFKHTGDITPLRHAVNELEPGKGAARDARLAHVLTTLYEQVRDSGLLERAIDLHRSAVAAPADNDPAKPDRLAAWAEAWVLYAERHSAPAALREAVRCYRAAQHGPLLSHRDTVTLRTGLALALHQLGLVDAEAAEARDEAVLLGDTVVREFPVGHPDRAAVLAPLGPVLASRLSSRARTSGTDLERVVAVSREHLSRLPEADPTRALRQMELGVALRERFSRERREADRWEACATFADAARSTVLPAVSRCLAAREWAALQVDAGDWSGAVEAYRLAVDLLPGATVSELRRDDQEFHLTSFAQLASDAAAAVLCANGAAEVAVDLLERGRGLLLSQALERDPDLGDDEGQAVGPIVAVNGSVHGCAALVVQPDGVVHIPLPDLTMQETIDRSDTFTIAVEILLQGDHDPEHHLAASRFVTRTLGWLWDVVAEPVLAAVRADRLWWMPTGALSFLPLHAAGYHHDGSGRTVLDRAISSYTPTLRMLRRSQVRASRVTLPANPLVVSQPETAGAVSLPSVTVETEHLLRLRPNAQVLSGSAASRTLSWPLCPAAAGRISPVTR